MWHPFDLMPEALAVPSELRNASTSTACRLVYRQAITRWFKDKSSKEQWPADLDLRPGLTLTRRMDGGGRWHMEVEQTWELEARRTFTGTIVCDMRGWRRPLRYEFQQRFESRVGLPMWLESRESGKWQEDGVLTRQSTIGDESIVQKVKADAWLAFYGLLGDFPAWADSWPVAGETAFWGEGGTVVRGARLRRCEAAQSQRAQAQGLRGYVLELQHGMPQEFWINENGVVIYWIEGPNRALWLESVEGLV